MEAFRFVEYDKANHAVTTLCRVLGRLYQRVLRVAY